MTLTRTVRRWLAALGATAAIVAVGAPPAAAAADDLALYANDAMIAPGGTLRTISVYPLTDEPLPPSTLTIDRSEVDAFALVEVPFGGNACTESGAVVTCAVQGSEGSALVHLSVSAKPDATAGQEGRLTLSLTTPDLGTATFRPTITVGEGVDLVAQEEISLSGPPGALLEAPISVSNRGERATRGAVVLVHGPYALSPDRRYENCEYAEQPIQHLGATVFACTFPDVLEPGATARLADGFALRFRPDAWAPNDLRGNAVWFTPADWQEFRSAFRLSGPLGPKGTEGVLGLETVATAAAAPPQTDLDPYTNTTALFLHVTGDQRADLEADGATGSGTVGATVPVTVGWTNNGPAAIDGQATNRLVTRAVVTVPVGTTAVAVPESCRDAQDDDGWGRPGAATYECHWYDTLPPGGQVRFPFELRIDRAGSLTGRIRLHHTYTYLDERRDLNPANDTAVIRINPSPGGGAGGGDGDGDGDGGTLPITGTPTGLIGGIGALLLIAGVAPSC